ncbi:hypothetical protein VD0001_g3534 [Verticillium dahliae]|nr:hypothetical protein VD0001_g3534 [Verticillium dahliae]
MSNDAQVEDHYFSANPPPKALARHVAQASAFLDHQVVSNRPVVLITSGGTTVPLERNTVRFIDNFSAGTRGATSAEYFLEAGYGVIFLHREFSLQPYSRHYSHATDCFLDFLQESPDGSVVANSAHQEKMLAVLRKYNTARATNALLVIPFVTITDYLHELRAISRLMRPLGPRGLLYLAAAASDFFVPPERMAEHKIQSTTATDSLQPAAPGNEQQKAQPQPPKKKTDETDNEETFDNFDSYPKVPRAKRLVIDLDPVPKFLKNLVDGWAPAQMIVSFKLETDPAILVHKARYSLDRYQHHLVIGTLLSTRKGEVVFVSPGRPDHGVRGPSAAREAASHRRDAGAAAAGRQGPTQAQAQAQGDEHVDEKPMDPAWLPDGEPEVEIESLIIPAVEALHREHIKASAASK